MVGIVVAMQEELLPIINHPSILAKPKGSCGRRPIFTTHFRTEHVDDTLVFMLSGIGRTNAARATASLIDLGCRAIMNIGTCGCTFKDKVVASRDYTFVPQKGAVWVPTEILDGEFDLSVFTGKKDPDPCHLWEKIPEKPADTAVRLFTVSHFCQEPLADYPYLVDMEAYDVVAVCDALNSFVRVIKVVSDSADKEADKTFDKDLNPAMSIALPEIIREIEIFITILNKSDKPKIQKKSPDQVVPAKHD